MASQPQPEEHKKSMSMAMAAPQLLTPDQPLAHTFVPSGPEPRMPSPPASPEFNAEASFQQKDDVLYPDHTNVDATHEERPLFETSASWTTPEREQRSPTASTLSVQTPRTSISSPSQRDDLQPQPRLLPQTTLPQTQTQKSPTPTSPAQLLNHYGLDWWRYCMAQNEERLQQKKMLASRELPPVKNTLKRDQYTADLVSSLGRTRIEKPGKTSAMNRTRTPKAAPAKPTARSQAPVATSRVDSPAKRSRRKTATPDPSLGSFTHAAQPKPRTRAAPTKKIDDKSNAEWDQLPNYCPPTTSLDTMSKKMTASWTNGNPLNLDTDPEREHLHPQELVVASTLRLHCNSYLANKRRIFAARFQALQDGKDFNKTSAQVSAKIDVNKSSKLWEAFDSVGWFDKHWFEQYM